MPVFGSYWETWYFVVCEQTCTIDHKMDQSLWQTIISFDLLHSSCKWIPAILLCGKHRTTMQTWIVSRLWFCRRPWRLKINIRRNSVHFRKSHVCANKLDVQETDFSFTRFYRNWDHFSRCRFTHGRYSRSHSLGFRWLKYFIPYRAEQMDPRESHGEPRRQLPSQTCITPSQSSTPRSFQQNIDHIPSKTTHSGSSAMLYVFEDNEAVIKMIIKGRNSTMKHVSRTHRVALDWLFDRINWDPKIQIRHNDTNSQTCWLKGISHVMSGTIFFMCSTSTISGPLAAPRISAW